MKKLSRGTRLTAKEDFPHGALLRIGDKVTIIGYDGQDYIVVADKDVLPYEKPKTWFVNIDVSPGYKVLRRKGSCK
jgi:hypothetical protein